MNTLFDSGTTNCERCGVRLKIATEQTPDARLLRKSLTAEGFCVNCCLTEWLQITEPINDLLRSPRCRTCGGMKYPKVFDKMCFCQPPQFPSIGEMLDMPQIRECIGQLLLAGKSDAKFGEIDWLEVAANWDLPFPKAKRKRGKR